MTIRQWLLAGALLVLALPALAADYPAQEADWVAPDFKFHTGEVIRPFTCTTPRSATRAASLS